MLSEFILTIGKQAPIQEKTVRISDWSEAKN